MLNHSLPNIEKFAAFIDGNLSQNEMQHFSRLAENENALHQLLDASLVVDNTITSLTDSDLQLPPEIVTSDFELPTIPTEGISPLVALSPEPMDDMFAANATYTDDDISMLSDINYENHSIIGGELQDESSRLMSENDGIDGGDDLSDLLSNDL